MELALGILAGLFAGALIGLGCVVYILSEAQRKVDAERMLVLNKAFVRDGQARLFSAAHIAGETGEESEFQAKPKTVAVASPFRSGLRKAKEEAEKSRPAIKLPDQVKDKIIAAKDAAANGAR